MRTQLSKPQPLHAIYIDPAIAEITYQYHRINVSMIVAFPVVIAFTMVVAMIVIITHIVSIQESTSRCGYPPG